MLQSREYVYSEFSNKKNGNRRRMYWGDIEEKVARTPDAEDWFHTINFYKSTDQTEDEQELTPIYFDFDSENIEFAKKDCQRLVGFLEQVFDIDDKDLIRIWFSGKKGFHVLIDPRVCDVKPHKDVTKQMKFMAHRLAARHNLGTLDMRVYTKRRLWRLPNTKHSGTGLYCVELEHNELHLPVEEIKELAKAPRHLGKTIPDVVEASGVDVWQSYIDAYDVTHKAANIARVQMKHQDDIGGHPACIRDILHNGIRLEGQRNHATVCLITYYLARGLEDEEIFKEVSEWTSKQRLVTSSPKDYEPEIRANIRYLRENKDSYFSCSYICALGRGTDKPVSCDGDKCEFVTRVSEAEQEPTEVDVRGVNHLVQGHKIKIKVQVNEKDLKPFLIPKRVQMNCSPKENSNVCKDCPHNGACCASLTYSSSLSDVTELLDPKKGFEATHKKKVKIPRHCPGCSFDEIESDTVRLYEVSDIVSINDKKSVKYRENQITLIMMNDTELDISAGYEIEGYAHRDEVTSKACIVGHSAKLINDQFLNFKVTPEKTEYLSRLQPEEWTVDSCKNKMIEIHNDIADHHTKIVGREDMAMAVDLVYHSPISFWIGEDFVRNGYMEAVIIGDPGQGKSEICKRMSDLYGVGDLISAENCTKAGILGNSQKNAHGGFYVKHGLLTKNDMGLVAFDECQNRAQKDLFRYLNDVRTSGRAKITKAGAEGGAEFPARCRKIFISNPHNGRKQSSYRFPIQMLTDMFPDTSQQSRTDIFLTTPERKNMDLRKAFPRKTGGTPKFPQALLQANLSWAWSRKPDDYIFEKEAEDLLRDLASKLTEKFYSDIHLIETNDRTEHKIASGAAALASRLHSCDTSGEKVIIKPCHIEMYYNFINDVYVDPEVDYARYAKEYQRKDKLPLEERISIISDFCGTVGKDGQEMCYMMLEEGEFSSKEYGELFGPGLAMMILRMCKRHYLIEKKGSQPYRFTPKGQRIFSELATIPTEHWSDYNSSSTREITQKIKDNPEITDWGA